jgi:hypothetical protein
MEKNNIIDELEYFPNVPKELLDRLKEDFDIRKMLKYRPDVEYLKGVQAVLDYLEEKHESNKRIDNEGE